MKTIAILFMLLMSAVLRAQDISTANLSWTVDQLNDLDASKAFDYSCTFITQGSNPIQWVQQSGALVNTLQVQSSEGAWTNITAQGKWVCHVTSEGQPGDITFERNSSGLFITVDFSRSTVNKFRHQYRVTQITAP